MAKQTIQKRFLNADDVAVLLDVSKSKAYRIIKQLNDNLKENHKITIAGKVKLPLFFRQFFNRLYWKCNVRY